MSDKKFEITDEVSAVYIHKAVELNKRPQCPKCQSDDLMWDQSYTVPSDVYDEIQIGVTCEECEFEFVERYNLFGIENVED